jgi:hypothetical protein
LIDKDILGSSKDITYNLNDGKYDGDIIEKFYLKIYFFKEFIGKVCNSILKNLTNNSSIFNVKFSFNLTKYVVRLFFFTQLSLNCFNSEKFSKKYLFNRCKCILSTSTKSPSLTEFNNKFIRSLYQSNINFSNYELIYDK